LCLLPFCVGHEGVDLLSCVTQWLHRATRHHRHAKQSGSTVMVGLSSCAGTGQRLRRVSSGSIVFGPTPRTLETHEGRRNRASTVHGKVARALAAVCRVILESCSRHRGGRGDRGAGFPGTGAWRTQKRLGA